jgi:hypothetical protein
VPPSQRCKSISAQRREQNGRNCSTCGLPQIGQGFAVLADAFNGSGSPAATGNLDAIVRSDGIYGSRWHLWRLHDGCICLHDGIYGENGIYGVCATDATPLCDGTYGRRWHLGVFTVNAISRRDGIYGQKWHLWRLNRIATSLCDGIYGVTWHLWPDMASMAGHGIYGGTWHLWGPRHLQNAPAQAAALTQPKWIG